MASGQRVTFAINLDKVKNFVKELLNRNEAATASSFVANLIKMHPKDMQLLVFGIDFEEEMGNFGMSMVYSKQRLNFKPDWELGYRRLASLQVTNGDLTAAMNTVRLGLEKKFDEKHLLDLEVEIERGLKKREEQLLQPNQCVHSEPTKRVTRSQSAISGANHVSLDDIKIKPKDDPTQYIIKEADQKTVEQAHNPVFVMLDIVKKQCEQAEPKTKAGVILDRCEAEYCQLPISKHVRFLYGESLIWAGSGDMLPSYLTSECWKELAVERRLPISCILFFLCDGWLAHISRTFTLKGCNGEFDIQIENISKDHAWLLEKMRPGEKVTCHFIYKTFKEYVSSTYKNIWGRAGVLKGIKKIGAGFYKDRRWIKSMQLRTCGTEIKEGMGFFTCITYQYLDRATEKYYPIVHGDTVIITTAGGKLFSTKKFEKELGEELSVKRKVEKCVASEEMANSPCVSLHVPEGQSLFLELPNDLDIQTTHIRLLQDSDIPKREIQMMKFFPVCSMAASGQTVVTAYRALHQIATNATATGNLLKYLFMRVQERFAASPLTVAVKMSPTPALEFPENQIATTPEQPITLPEPSRLLVATNCGSNVTKINQGQPKIPVRHSKSSALMGAVGNAKAMQLKEKEREDSAKPRFRY